jgi:uncharacterized protein (DUF2236 family)
MSDEPRDDGLLGPDAVAWRVIGHPGALIGGLRSLIIQSLHPLAIAGVAQHSDYQRRPLDRLHRTTYYVAATAFGDTDTALAAAERVRRRHSTVRGIDPVTGQRYSADDPDTQVWVHATEWHSFLAAHRVFGGRLSVEEEDRYIAEGAIVGSLLGTPQERIPASLAEMRAYFERVRPQLCVSESACTAIAFVVNPPATRETLPYYVALRVYANAAVALVPRDLRTLAGIDRPRALDLAAIAAARPLVTAAGLPGLRDLAGRVVGRETRDLIQPRLRNGQGARETELRRAA